MARSKSGTVPGLQLHKATGQGKVHLSGRDFYCGKWGTPSCKATYDRLIAEWLHNGRRAPLAEPKRPVSAADVRPRNPPPPLEEVRLDPTGMYGGDRYRAASPPPTGLLICQIAARYVEHCETYYRMLDGTLSSTFGNVLQVIDALRPYDDLPASSFGPKRLQEMRTLLVEHGRPRKSCNRIVKGVKRMFRWAESQELVHAGMCHALSTVEPLKRGRTTAPEMQPVTFWRVLQDEELFSQFLRLCEATPFSEHEWDLCSTRLTHDDPVVRAHAFFVLNRQSRQGMMRHFATLSRNRVRRNMNEQASSWLTAIDGLPEMHERLKRVVLLNRKAVDVTHQQDGDSTLFYLDPPYVSGTREAKSAYKHEMDDQDHHALVDEILACSGKVMLSGYASPIYERLERHGLCTRDFIVTKSSSSQATKPMACERIWANFELCDKAE